MNKRKRTEYTDVQTINTQPNNSYTSPYSHIKMETK